MSVKTRQPGSMEQLRRHNLLRVLRAVYSGAAESRAALAAVTGLTKPTVSTLVSELLAEGLLSERGEGRSGERGGKRPTLLRFEPRARQVIGISVVGNRALGALSDLAGETSALHVRELPARSSAETRRTPAGRPGGESSAIGADDLIEVVADVTAALIAQLDAPLLGVGVGLPGSATAPIVAQELERRFAVPAHSGNQAELSALGQLAFADGVDPGVTLVNLIVDGGVEMGVGHAGGAIHYGSDLGEMHLPGDGVVAGGAPTVRERLAWAEVKDRVARALGTFDQRGEPPAEAAATYLRLRSAAAHGDPAAKGLIEELARDLAVVLAWVVAAVRPGQVSLGGRLSDLGEPFLDLVRERAAAIMPATQLEEVVLSLAYSEQLGAMGAVALVLQAELELLQS